MLILIATLSCYYFLFEIIEVINSGSVWIISDIWNIIDWAHIISTLVYVFQERLPRTFDRNMELQFIVAPLALFFTWIKIFNMLRMFKNIGFMVSIIVEVCKETIFFLLIMFLEFLAFSETFNALSISIDGEMKSEDMQYIPGPTNSPFTFSGEYPYPSFNSLIYVYRISLGEWELNADLESTEDSVKFF